MKIIEYVDTQIVPMLNINPIEALVEVKKWNNVLNYRKSTPEVKKIRDAITYKIPQICEYLQKSLLVLSKTTNSGSEFVKKWRDANQEYQNIKALLNSLLESTTDDGIVRLTQLQESFDSLIKNFCVKLEDDLSQLKIKDRKVYEENTFRRVKFSIDDEIYCFVSPSTKSEEFIDTLLKIKQNKFEVYYSGKFKQEADDALFLRDKVIHLKQIIQSFTFNIEKLDEGLLEIIRSDTTVQAFLSCLTTRLEGNHIYLENPLTATAFLKEVL